MHCQNPFSSSGFGKFHAIGAAADEDSAFHFYIIQFHTLYAVGNDQIPFDGHIAQRGIILSYNEIAFQIGICRFSVFSDVSCQLVKHL